MIDVLSDVAQFDAPVVQKGRKESKAMAAKTSMSESTLESVEVSTPAEAAKILKLSQSWLAKARMRGEGPPFIRIGRSVRYVRLRQWLRSR